MSTNTPIHILDKLYNVLQERKNKTADQSYVASLYAGGSQKIAAKITEEAAETIQEALNLEQAPDDPSLRKALTQESTDLLFHLLVMLAHHDIKPEALFSVLEQRFGLSGHDEKAARPHTDKTNT